MSDYPLEFVFGKIIQTTQRGIQKIQYGVKWEGFGPKDITYEPIQNFKDKSSLEEYEFLQDIQTMEKLTINQPVLFLMINFQICTHIICRGVLEKID